MIDGHTHYHRLVDVFRPHGYFLDVGNQRYAYRNKKLINNVAEKKQYTWRRLLAGIYLQNQNQDRRRLK
jgi:hypothetical protein